MKKKEIIYGIARLSNGKYVESRSFVNPEAFSRWANKMFLKDNEVIIREFRDFKQYCIWSA